MTKRNVVSDRRDRNVLIDRVDGFVGGNFDCPMFVIPSLTDFSLWMSSVTPKCFVIVDSLISASQGNSMCENAAK